MQPKEKKPLVLLFAWFQSNPKHLEKFCILYTNLGFDVLVITVELMKLLRPEKGSQIVAGDILKFLEQNDFYKSILLHGFSMGGYIWGECLVKTRDHVSKYEPLIGRIKGQVWDSMTGSKEIPVGKAKAFFPNNLLLQETVRQLSVFFLDAFYNFSTKHYEKAENYFHQKPVAVPTLLIFSKTDSVGTALKSLTIADDFEALNIRVKRKCFDDSPHVGHFHKHKEEYTEELIKHLKLCKLLS